MIVPLFLDTEDHQYFPDDARAAVREVCLATEPEIRALLPTLPETIELASRTGTMVIPETGELGLAESPRRVSWTVDPSRPGGIAAVVRSQMRSMLFHELHHLARGWVASGGQPPTSFMEGVVSEGLATAFQRDFGGWTPPWSEYPKDVRLWIDELLELPLSASYYHWMFFHPDGRRWIGYRAGTYIADQAIGASGRSAAELVRVPVDEILRMAGMRPS